MLSARMPQTQLASSQASASMYSYLYDVKGLHGLRSTLQSPQGSCACAGSWTLTWR